MNQKDQRQTDHTAVIGFLISLAVGIVMSLLVSWYEISCYGTEWKMLMYSLSAGFFATAVLYIGFGLLTLIAASGNFYGLQYIGYALVFTFSFRKAHFEKRRKSYYDYVLEKKAKQAQGKSPLSRLRTLITGGVLLVISLVFTALFYL